MKNKHFNGNLKVTDVNYSFVKDIEIIYGSLNILTTNNITMEHLKFVEGEILDENKLLSTPNLEVANRVLVKENKPYEGLPYGITEEMIQVEPSDLGVPKELGDIFSSMAKSGTQIFGVGEGGGSMSIGSNGGVSSTGLVDLTGGFTGNDKVTK